MVKFTSIHFFMLITFLISLIGFYLFHLSEKRKGFKREVREETGERHAAKSHVPDMGGVVMLLVYAIVFPVYIWFLIKKYEFMDNYFMVFYFAPLFFGGLGMIDDVMKRRFKSTRGLRALIRLPLQAFIAIIVCCFLLLLYEGSFEFHRQMGWDKFFIALMGTVIYVLATINAANFTDGLDGLLTGCAIIAIWALLILDNSAQFLGFNTDFKPVPDLVYSVLPLMIMIAFLFFNAYPAKIFMGDTGSMFIGSFLALLPIVTHNITFSCWVIVCFVIYFNLISVVLQVISFRLFKRRIFPMTPFHHSFEKWGWHENHIVWFYYFMSVVFAFIGYIYLKS